MFFTCFIGRKVGLVVLSVVLAGGVFGQGGGVDNNGTLKWTPHNPYDRFETAVELLGKSGWEGTPLKVGEKVPDEHILDDFRIKAGVPFMINGKKILFSPYEVSSEDFCAFLNEKGNPNGSKYFTPNAEATIQFDAAKNIYKPKDGGYENHPANYVTWYGANEYSKWVGGRLPTAAEWKVMAEGVGASCSTGSSGANYNLLSVYYGDLEYMDKYYLYHICGNVAEWTSDKKNGEYVVKGGWGNPLVPNAQNCAGLEIENCSFLSPPEVTGNHIGFRVVFE